MRHSYYTCLVETPSSLQATSSLQFETRVNREAAKEAALQIAHWANVIIPSMEKLHSYEDEIHFERLKCSMERFELEELMSQGQQNPIALREHCRPA